jgi:hypothetical protein
MWRLIGFFYPLITVPCYFNGMEQMGNEKTWRCWRGEFERLPEGRRLGRFGKSSRRRTGVDFMSMAITGVGDRKGVLRGLGLLFE